MSLLVLVLALSSGANGAVLRDVPLGECHMCEVTCFEDCSLKYTREIMQHDMAHSDMAHGTRPGDHHLFLQVPAKNETSKPANRSKIGQEYAECLKADKCPCAKEDAKAAAAANVTNKTSFLQAKNATPTCDLDQETCAVECANKVVKKAHDKLDAEKKAKAVEKKSSKMFLLQRDYPIHSVQVGVFTKGHMTLAECHKFCLAATCGCDKAPGLGTIDKLFKAIKANDAAEPGEKDFSHRGAVNNQKGGGVIDTHASYQFRPAKIEECAKGMIGKKVVENMYVDFGGGVGGELKVCKKKFMERLFGPGDHKKKEKLCASTKSEDAKWGCIWNEKKSYCMVGFSPNLRCQIRFIDDPSRL